MPSTIYSFELFSAPDISKAWSDTWLESDERTREWVTGWDTLSERICWGRRESVMRQAIAAAKLRITTGNIMR